MFERSICTSIAPPTGSGDLLAAIVAEVLRQHSRHPVDVVRRTARAFNIVEHATKRWRSAAPAICASLWQNLQANLLKKTSAASSTTLLESATRAFDAFTTFFECGGVGNPLHEGMVVHLVENGAQTFDLVRLLICAGYLECCIIHREPCGHIVSSHAKKLANAVMAVVHRAVELEYASLNALVTAALGRAALLVHFTIADMRAMSRAVQCHTNKRDFLKIATTSSPVL